MQGVGFQTCCTLALSFCSNDTLPPHPEAWANPADAEIRFYDEVMTFGEAEDGDEVLAEYIFSNIGTSTLEIEIVSACDCIRTDWPKVAILPGDLAKITATYVTTGHVGESEKTLDVIFKNTDFNGYPLVKQLKLIGKIVPK